MPFVRLLVLALPLLAGCVHVTWVSPDAFAVVHGLGRQAERDRAPYTAEYVLWKLDGRAEVLSRPLLQGQPVGFVLERDGVLFALAAKERVQLDEGVYAWRVRPETAPSPEEFGRAQRGELWTYALAGVVIAGTVAGLIALL